MTPFNSGDVVLIGFPFTDLSGSKQRPALIISSLWYNENKIDVILAAITSQVPAKPDDDEYILSQKELRAAGLPKESMVKAGKIVTLDRRLIRKKLGRLPDESLYHVKNILLKVHI